MKRPLLGLSTSLLLWLAAVGCGESTSGDGPSAGSGGQPGAAGSAANGGSLASAGSAAGTSNTNAGSPSGGTGTASGGSSSAAGAAGDQEPAEGGASSGGAAGDLAVCDPKKVLCKLLPGECPGMQVRAVAGTCWGECVDIAHCACAAADDCPDNDQYTCWSRTHCGPYVN